MTSPEDVLLGDNFPDSRRSEEDKVPWATIQWHGGIPQAQSAGNNVTILGGFFLAGDQITKLGLDPRQDPPPGWEAATIKNGTVPGWGAALIHVAVFAHNFSWEYYDPITGQRTSVPEYRDGCRGRLRILCAVRELLPHGPVAISVRGSASRNMKDVLRELEQILNIVNQFRRSHGKKPIASESFWLPVKRSEFKQVGKPPISSLMSLPELAVSIPKPPDTAFIAKMLVEEPLRNTVFGEWAQEYLPIWDKQNKNLSTSGDTDNTAENGERQPPVSTGAPVGRELTYDEQALELAERHTRAAAKQLGQRAHLPPKVSDIDRLIAVVEKWGFNPENDIGNITAKFLGESKRCDDYDDLINGRLTAAEVVGLTNALLDSTSESLIDIFWPAS